MEALAVVGLVGTIVQFVDFGGKLISKSIQLYNDGVLTENVDIETVTNDLVALNKKLKDDGIVGDGTLQSLSLSCQNAANDLLEALKKVTVKDKQQKWESVRKALRTVWSKDKLTGLEHRLAKLKAELNLHIVVHLSEQVSQFKREHLSKLESLDLATKSILDAVADRRDVFQAAHEVQIALTEVQESTTRNINDTRQEIIQEMRKIEADTARQKLCLDILSNATQAAFNSSERQHDSMCLHNTRVGVLNEIRAWADGQDQSQIYWLNGLAGTGKSTIARTIAREYFEQGRLGASFFFSKGGGDVGHAGKFFTTMAFQLAKKSSSLKNYICDAISKNRDIKNQSLRDQWHQLILQPLSMLDGNSPPSSYILVVDALDECEGESDIRAILQLLAEAQSLRTVQLRVFLTSRPEIPIRHGFYQISDSKHQEAILHNISPSIIDHDIHIFMEYNFKLIGQKRSLKADWPGQQIIKLLVQKASGLFIWAATACRFVGDGKRFAVKRLAMILDSDIDSTTAPEKHLNEIYVTVLRQSIDPNFTDEEKKEQYQVLRQTLGSMVILFSPLSADSLCRLLHATKEDLDQTLEDLHAILDVPKDQTQPLRLHHPSFRDFLINKERCGDPDFWIEEKQAHQILADNSIQLMSDSLKQDICSQDAYDVFAHDINSSKVQEYIPQEVQYACLYWIQHLQMSNSQLYDDDKVHRFLKVHVLHWLEALSWMRKFPEGIYAITSLESSALASDCPGFYAFVHDIKRFMLYSRPAIEQAPLQVYSALIFAPMMSSVRKRFENRIPRWIKRKPKVEKDWSAVLQTLEDYSLAIMNVAFSPDCKVLASTSNGGMVRLWDPVTGVALQTLQGHSDRARAVAFSLDGKVLASGSWDWTVKLWDAGTGAALQTLRGHLGWVNAVAFSPDGKVIASASSDKTIKLWEVGTGVTLKTLLGHSSWVAAVAFSPNGEMLASASEDKTVKLWNDSTGAVLQTFQGHSDLVGAVVFSPDGKVLASASVDETVKLWEVGTEVAQKTLIEHSSGVNAVAFSPDGKVLASASDDKTIKLWDAGTGAELQTFIGHSSDIVAIAFSPDGKVLASASLDKTVNLWDAGTRVALQALLGHSAWISAVTFSPDAKTLASASHDETVKLWDAGTGAALQTLKGHSSPVTDVAFSPDGETLASASEDQTVKLWDNSTGAELQTLRGHSDRINRVLFSPDGKVLASASVDKTVRLWDAGSGAALHALKDHASPVTAIAFSQDGKALASRSGIDTVKMWDTGTGVALQTLQDDLDPVTFSLDERVLESASVDETARLWEVSTRVALQTLQGSTRTLAFSPDGKVLASASASASGPDDETVKLWDVGTGAALQTLSAEAIVPILSSFNDGITPETDKGIKSFFPNEFPSRRDPLFVKDRWVVRGKDGLIRLPSEYCPTCLAVNGSVIALGSATGRFIIIEFDF